MLELCVCVFFNSKKFEPGDKVTFSHQDYLCNGCVNWRKAQSAVARASAGSPERVEAHVELKASPPTKGSSVSAPCTPAKMENSLMDGHLSTPALDYSSDGK